MPNCDIEGVSLFVSMINLLILSLVGSCVINALLLSLCPMLLVFDAFLLLGPKHHQRNAAASQPHHFCMMGNMSKDSVRVKVQDDLKSELEPKLKHFSIFTFVVSKFATVITNQIQCSPTIGE
mmetsp:Transcript_16162/g.23607  ORF Transcript_16162/g.23607 Transcript_16162/m.23607 type:complete len:123 (+) Transcript_16162:4-372(+)